MTNEPPFKVHIYNLIHMFRNLVFHLTTPEIWGLIIQRALEAKAETLDEIQHKKLHSSENRNQMYDAYDSLIGQYYLPYVNCKLYCKLWGWL